MEADPFPALDSPSGGDLFLARDVDVQRPRAVGRVPEARGNGGFWTESADGELLLGIGAQDQDALGVAVRKYWSLCLSVTRKILRDKGEAEDACNDAFQRLWEAARSLHKPFTLRYLVCQYATNAAIDHLRRRRGRSRKAGGAQPRARVQCTPVDPRELPEPARGTATPDEELIARTDARRLLERAARDASRKGQGKVQQAAGEWLLVDVGGLTCEEVAANEGVPPSSVRSRVGWYRRRLREVIEDR